MNPLGRACVQDVLWTGAHLDPDLAYLLLFIVSHDNCIEENVSYFRDEMELLVGNALPIYRARAAYEHLRANGVLATTMPLDDEVHGANGLYLFVKMSALNLMVERGGVVPRPQSRRRDNVEDEQ